MTEQAGRQENKMGVMPVKKLLLSMSLPMMISMLVQALYNVVDSVFVARIGDTPVVGENALTAVSLAFPLQNLMISLAVGTGVGINALLSKSLGEKDYERANRAANVGIFLAAINTIAFVLIGLFLIKPYFAILTNDPQIYEFGVSYMSICAVLSFGVFGQVTFERLLQSTGKTFYTMIAQGAGAIVNIIMDPLLIFGLLGFPEMGVAGAAVATVMGQIIGMLLGLFFNLKYNREIKINIRDMKPQAAVVKRIYAVGVPSTVMGSVGSVMLFGMNSILMTFTPTAIAVFGVYFKLQSFIFMPVFGLNNGMVPIVAYNYGAANRKRLVQTIRYSVFYAVCMMLVGFAIFQMFPRQLLLLFDPSDDMLTIGVAALRAISYSFLFAGFCVICGSVFQALGNGMLSLLISVIRQLLVLLPAAWLLSLTGNLHYVWLAFPIAELVTVVMSAVFLRHIYLKTIVPMPAGAPDAVPGGILETDPEARQDDA